MTKHIQRKWISFKYNQIKVFSHLYNFRACAVVLRVKTQDYSWTKASTTSWGEWSDLKIQLVSISLSHKA